jgi:hypothetical protein
MKNIDVGRLINTIANIGVIGGLIFVGLQLKQDSDIAERATLFDATNSRLQWAELVRESGEVWVKGLAGEELTDYEYAEFDALATAWELSHYTYYRAQELVSLDPSRFVREWALELDSHPGLLNWWHRYRKRMDYTDPDSDQSWPISVDAELQRLSASKSTTE